MWALFAVLAVLFIIAGALLLGRARSGRSAEDATLQYVHAMQSYDGAALYDVMLPEQRRAVSREFMIRCAREEKASAVDDPLSYWSGGARLDRHATGISVSSTSPGRATVAGLGEVNTTVVTLQWPDQRSFDGVGAAQVTTVKRGNHYFVAGDGVLTEADGC